MADLVHLVRHGEVHNPRGVVYASLPGFHLNRRGHRQSGEAGSYLADRPLGSVWSSPLRRARETAINLAAPHHLDVNILPELGEWKLLDRWAGHPWDRITELFPGEMETYLSHPHDLSFATESLGQLAERMAKAVVEVAGTTADREVVVVGHQDPIQAVRLALTGRPLDRLFRDKPGHCSVITLRPGTPWTELGKWDPPSR